MAPKFKGRSDEWLDDEKSTIRSSGGNKRKDVKARATGLPPSEANATVVEVFPKQARVRLDTGAEILCSYRWANLIAHGRDELRERSPVTIGDRIVVEQNSPQSGVVVGLCVRRNQLLRVAPGREGEDLFHAVAANLDQLVIVASVDKPEFSAGLIDRYLIASHAQNIAVLICLTKTDLPEPSGVTEWLKIYRDLGYEILPVAAKAGTGIEALRKKLSGLTAVFCGHSGVGKTSLLRSLTGTELGKTETVSESTGKGRHTTTSSVLLASPDKNPATRWIDTPGVREFNLAEILPENLGFYFPELKSLSCAVEKNCRHQAEPYCVARSLPRYPSYLRILESLLEQNKTT